MRVNLAGALLVPVAVLAQLGYTYRRVYSGEVEHKQQEALLQLASMMSKLHVLWDQQIGGFTQVGGLMR
jgi:hypothetical protein